MDERWTRAFVARVAGMDRLAEMSGEDAAEEAALTLDVLIRDARVALGIDPVRVP